MVSCYNASFLTSFACWPVSAFHDFFSRSRVLEAGYAVGRALAWLHAQGLCHTDLKPSNVLLTATNGWKLCDFASATKEGALFGEATFHYCAPEQVKLMIHKLPLVASFDADVWAYSKMLYEMAVGSPDGLVSPSTSDVLTLEVIAAFQGPSGRGGKTAICGSADCLTLLVVCAHAAPEHGAHHGKGLLDRCSHVASRGRIRLFQQCRRGDWGHKHE
jgi:serine/threonine protein kinase